MCAKAAFIIQGKSSPHYRPNKIVGNDKIVIVNARYTYLTGKKITQKLYRHHTGFPGGLKEIPAKLYLEEKPEEMVTRSIKGMLPKNKMRAEYLKKVIIFAEGGHNLNGLPQFGSVKPIDYNKILGTDIATDPAQRKQLKIIGSNVSEEDIRAKCKYSIYI